ncbi:pyridoxal phosphate-dependent aminotransferase [Agrobacterium rosae]|uniref:Aminotransferase n=1 Tax=Agrobacterium rosae TaxID=1972867 RepID=A0AAW9FIV6_9HYPH|nr:pyridoxal phosphate-dependent aminotransferase [Agrobacterium rosae]MDX8304482.1 pyridoxal phosphate-dependent aminotransferase [Agrobacterium rosae]
MFMIAPRLNAITLDASESASQVARTLLSQGVDIISLATGEPDFATPDHVCKAVIEAMERGDTKYTLGGGTVEMRRAVIEKFARDNHLTYEMNEVIVGPGAKNLIHTALNATIGPGDEVIVPAPYWVSYTDMVKLSEGEPIVLTGLKEHGYKLTAAQIDKAITGRTRWLILNSPSNPSGMIYTREELADIADVLRAHPHVWVLADDIYEHIIFEGNKFETIAAVAPDLKDRVLTLNGVSKAYAMTGWRLGYAGGPASLIKAMRKIQSQTLGSVCSISQAAAVAALNGPQEYLKDRARSFQARRDRVLEMIADIPGLTAETPQGAFYIWVDCSGIIGKKTEDGLHISNDKNVAKYILEKARQCPHKWGSSYLRYMIQFP